MHFAQLEHMVQVQAAPYAHPAGAEHTAQQLGQMALCFAFPAQAEHTAAYKDYKTLLRVQNAWLENIVQVLAIIQQQAVRHAALEHTILLHEAALKMHVYPAKQERSVQPLDQINPHCVSSVQ